MTAEDEKFSITAAFTVMLVLSIVALVGVGFGLNPFSIGFNAAFVFLPTLGLLVWFVWARSNKNR